MPMQAELMQTSLQPVSVWYWHRKFCFAQFSAEIKNASIKSDKSDKVYRYLILNIFNTDLLQIRSFSIRRYE